MLRFQNSFEEQKKITQELETDLSLLYKRVALERELHEEAMSSLRDYLQQFKEYQQLNDSLSDEKQHMLSMQGEIEHQLSLKSQEVSELQDILANRETDWSKARTSYTEIYEELMESVKGLENALDNEKSQKEVVLSQFQELLKHAQQAKEQVSYLEDLTNRLKDELWSINRANEELHHNRILKEQMLAELNHSLECKAQEQQETEMQHSTQVKSMEDKLQDLLVEREEKIELTDRLMHEMALSNERIKNLDRELSRSRESEEFIQRESLSTIEDLRAAVLVKNQAIDFFAGELLAADQYLVHKQYELESLTLSYISLRKTLEDQAIAFKDSFESEAEKSDFLNKELTSLRFNYEFHQARAAELEQELDRLKNQLMDASMAFQILEKHNWLVQGEFSFVAKENENLIEERDLLMNQLENYRQDLDAQKDHVRELSENLEEQKNAYREMENSHFNLLAELEKAKKTEQKQLLNELQEKPTEEQFNPEPYSQSQLPDKEFNSFHVVAEGENLNNISMKYYGTPNRWADIYHANLDLISDVNKIKVGTVLQIPE